MAADTEMVYIQMPPDERGNPGPRWKINPRDEQRIQQLVDVGGEIVSGYQTKDSHSDQAIEGANTFLGAGLTEPQAKALIAEGYVDLEAAKAAPNEELEAVDGIGPATVEKIREA